MEEAIRRMEAGEDPDKIEEEMGDLRDTEEPAFGESGRSLRQLSKRLKPPKVDDTIYDSQEIEEISELPDGFERLNAIERQGTP